MDTTSVAPATRPDTRELRALALYREHGGEIERTGPYTYLVPSCTGTGSWAVNYRRETCDCPDYERRGVPCKHVYAVGIKRAKRRGGRR
jgi:hypothetical protein